MTRQLPLKSNSDNGMHRTARALDVHIIDVSESEAELPPRCHDFIAVPINACRQRPAA